LSDLAKGSGREQRISADPFELWRSMWSIANSTGVEQLADAVPGAAATARPRCADAFEFSTLLTVGRVRIGLATMALLEQRKPSRAKVRDRRALCGRREAVGLGKDAAGQSSSADGV